jgi:hypothetical protein
MGLNAPCLTIGRPALVSSAALLVGNFGEGTSIHAYNPALALFLVLAGREQPAL